MLIMSVEGGKLDTVALKTVKCVDVAHRKVGCVDVAQ